MKFLPASYHDINLLKFKQFINFVPNDNLKFVKVIFTAFYWEIDNVEEIVLQMHINPEKFWANFRKVASKYEKTILKVNDEDELPKNKLTYHIVIGFEPVLAKLSIANASKIDFLKEDFMKNVNFYKNLHEFVLSIIVFHADMDNLNLMPPFLREQKENLFLFPLTRDYIKNIK